MGLVLRGYELWGLGAHPTQIPDPPCLQAGGTSGLLGSPHSLGSLIAPVIQYFLLLLVL